MQLKEYLYISPLPSQALGSVQRKQWNCFHNAGGIVEDELAVHSTNCLLSFLESKMTE